MSCSMFLENVSRLSNVLQPKPKQHTVTNQPSQTAVNHSDNRYSCVLRYARDAAASSNGTTLSGSTRTIMYVM